MRVLVVCEESATVREAFAQLGHDAWSCDLVPSRIHGNHLQMDAREAITFRKWDLIINHPPCTYTALCGNRWYWNSPLRIEGAKLCKEIWDFACQYSDHVALEQPKTIMQRYIGKRSQVIHPHQFGHGETKETWLWLKNLPLLKPTNIVEGREQRIWKMPPSATRSRDRAVTFPGIARAMAEQWGECLT